MNPQIARTYLPLFEGARRDFERWRDGLRGVSPVRGSPRTKIRAEGSSNLS